MMAVNLASKNYEPSKNYGRKLMLKL
jgi:hypothetical protein